MAHSTGTESRLNRGSHEKFGDAKYAKEELVAELTAAMVGNSMGFDKRILDNNAAYLDGWISTLKENPKFIVSVIADVNKAANMVLEEVDRQKIALGEDLCSTRTGTFLPIPPRTRLPLKTLPLSSRMTVTMRCVPPIKGRTWDSNRLTEMWASSISPSRKKRRRPVCSPIRWKKAMAI